MCISSVSNLMYSSVSSCFVLLYALALSMIIPLFVFNPSFPAVFFSPLINIWRPLNCTLILCFCEKVFPNFLNIQLNPFCCLVSVLSFL